MGLVNRIRLEANGRTEEEVDHALTDATLFIAQSFGGTWYEDEDHPRQVQTAVEGYWGFVWVKRVVVR